MGNNHLRLSGSSFEGNGDGGIEKTKAAKTMIVASTKQSPVFSFRDQSNGRGATAGACRSTHRCQQHQHQQAPPQLIIIARANEVTATNPPLPSRGGHGSSVLEPA